MCDWTSEAPLAELLDDPVAMLVMRSDGVDPRSIERLLATVDRERSRQTSEAEAE
ncbi:MAG TPA: hypothetical protein VFA12_08165 [Stellaceae bacterium]|nr:hypothetical protein [Stellaceae bacterium]